MRKSPESEIRLHMQLTPEDLALLQALEASYEQPGGMAPSRASVVREALRALAVARGVFPWKGANPATRKA